MSRPADPASRRKQAVAAVSRRGGSTSSRISPRHIEVSGTSAVGNGPQVVTLEVVGVLLELGQVTGRHHRLGEDQGGRPHLLELVGVTVEGEGGERPEQPGAEPAEEGEHGAGQLGPALHVEEPELGADLPVGHPLGVAVGRAVRRARTGHHVVLGAGTVGGVGSGQVGQVQQGLAHLLLGRLGHGVERRRSSSPSGRLRRRSAPRPGPCHRTCRASPTCFESALTSARSSSRRPMAARARWSSSASRSSSAGSTPRRPSATFTDVEVVPHQPDIDHDGHNGSVTTRGRRQAPTGAVERSAEDRGPAVVCDGVVIRYGETVAVDRLSFTGRAGEVVALLGPNGAGKTSTVEALEGYRRVDGGIGPGPRPRSRPRPRRPGAPASG